MTSTKKKKNTTKCTQDVRSIPPAAYMLLDDGRKAKLLCSARRTLLMQLATYADGDGSSIKPSVNTLARDLGWSGRTVNRRLRDLKTLGYVADKGTDEYHLTKIRAIDIASVTKVFGPQPAPEGWQVPIEAPASDSPNTPLTDSETTPDRFAGTACHIDTPPLTDSQVPLTDRGVPLTPKVAHNRHNDRHALTEQSNRHADRTDSASGQVGFEESVENLEAVNLEGKTTTSLMGQPPTSIGAPTNLPKNCPPPAEGFRWVACANGFREVPCE
jgi:hypothetical protein